MALRQAQRKLKDHRQLGRQLELFFFDELAPGVPFWLPKGMIIFKELEKFIRQETEAQGYEETSTPILVKSELFKQSGHWEHFRQNMFNFDLEGEAYSLKPMNCPESTLVYRFKTRSYRDLPLRFSELGRLHRNERTGTIGGMFRVRGMTMDDAHIYCRPDQMQEEITEMLDLILAFYQQLGLPASFALATRPEKALGKVGDWNEAEKQLAQALKSHRLKYKTLPKEGAFYGPKIHIDITDSLGRPWTLATIQVDFQMPERFKLEYIDEGGKAQRPVMIHRAVFGTFERFIGILLEHFEGKLPVWLSPVQAVVIPVAPAFAAYAQKIAKQLEEDGIRTEARVGEPPLSAGSRRRREKTLSAKIREAELEFVPYILVVGEKEEKSAAAALRLRDKGDLGAKKVKEIRSRIGKIVSARSLDL